MSREKRRKEQPFNAPFAKLRERGLEAPGGADRDARAAGTSASARGPSVSEGKGRRAQEDDEAALFLEAVGGARALPPSPSRAPTSGGAGTRRGTEVSALLDDADVQGELASLLGADEAALEACAVDDDGVTIEAAVRGFDPRMLRRLRGGELSLDARLDLHGRTSDEARGELERFVTASRRVGHRCVLVICGRGLHSGEGGPVLRGRVAAWLRVPPLARELLAFCRAPAREGGDGAFCLLLRRAAARTALDRQTPRR